ncbi:hypothetical protein [Roseomonas harenae]|uniref:hypothetical protein n=1 Tax=Muricoccus harenae TaxID=2692566 RepID=UPI001331624C|nr:hypothetical protein [Roseomonas harenae]
MSNPVAARPGGSVPLIPPPFHGPFRRHALLPAALATIAWAALLLPSWGMDPMALAPGGVLCHLGAWLALSRVTPLRAALAFVGLLLLFAPLPIILIPAGLLLAALALPLGAMANSLGLQPWSAGTLLLALIAAGASALGGAVLGWAAVRLRGWAERIRPASERAGLAGGAIAGLAALPTALLPLVLDAGTVIPAAAALLAAGFVPFLLLTSRAEDRLPSSRRVAVLFLLAALLAMPALFPAAAPWDAPENLVPAPGLRV